MRRFEALVLLALLCPASVFAAWTPPLGIPTPAWPSAVDMPRPTLPSAWTGDVSGFYYIASSGCSDARTLGNPNAPRCSLPNSVAAGAVIVINGTYSGTETISYSGTANAPVWIMGSGTSTKPVVKDEWSLNGSYIVVDGFTFDMNGPEAVNLSGNHIMLRGSSMTNPYGSSNGAGYSITGKNIVYYDNIVSEMGNWQYVGPDIDRQGIKVEGTASDVWIVDSVFYHCQSDGVQVGDANNTPSQINRIYVGRNVAYENLQFGFWTKNATDVIFSQNIVHDHLRSTASGPGGGLGGQYDPKYVWFINNLIYQNNGGIHVAGTSDGGGGPWYAIGNVIYSISADGECNGYDFGAISYRNDGGFTALFNTVHDVDFFGGYPPSGGTVTLRDNIFSSKKSNSCSAFEVERSIAHDYNLFSSSTYDPDGEAHRVVGAPGYVSAGTNFVLTAGSLAVDAANPTEEAAFATFQTRYGLNIRKDIANTTRPVGGGWDIGAYELGGTGPTPRPPAALTAQ